MLFAREITIDGDRNAFWKPICMHACAGEGGQFYVTLGTGELPQKNGKYTKSTQGSLTFSIFLQITQKPRWYHIFSRGNRFLGKTKFYGEINGEASLCRLGACICTLDFLTWLTNSAHVCLFRSRSWSRILRWFPFPSLLVSTNSPSLFHVHFHYPLPLFLEGLGRGKGNGNWENIGQNLHAC